MAIQVVISVVKTKQDQRMNGRNVAVELLKQAGGLQGENLEKGNGLFQPGGTVNVRLNLKQQRKSVSRAGGVKGMEGQLTMQSSEAQVRTLAFILRVTGRCWKVLSKVVIGSDLCFKEILAAVWRTDCSKEQGWGRGLRPNHIERAAVGSRMGVGRDCGGPCVRHTWFTEPPIY